MIVLGIDLGSSSVKVTLFDSDNGLCLGTCVWPEQEMPIHSPQTGWAEQAPSLWWQHCVTAVQRACAKARISTFDIGAVGIAYQMHGLVCLDNQNQVVGNANIWCDSRTVATGKAAFDELGHEWCFTHLLNSPGNFTAAKIKWMAVNQPELFSRVTKIMLPGDFIALQLSGIATTTVSGLSEAILWDFEQHQPAYSLLKHWGLDSSLLPEVLPNFANCLTVSDCGARAMGLKAGIPISYRAGDQPNNAFSLNVRQAGELAATGGTSAVLYAVNARNVADLQQRINTFLHVTPNTALQPTGLLMCLNGGGRAYAWLRELLAVTGHRISYADMNTLAESVDVGANGLQCLPFGNGAERIFSNQSPGAHYSGLDYNRHSSAHMARATLEGIAYAMRFGFDHLQSLDCQTHIIRASNGNLFQSRLFSQTIASLTRCPIDLINTDGSEGAARAAAIGAGAYHSDEAFDTLDVQHHFEPDPKLSAQLDEQYQCWLEHLSHISVNRS